MLLNENHSPNMVYFFQNNSFLSKFGKNFRNKWEYCDTIICPIFFCILAKFCTQNKYWSGERHCLRAIFFFPQFCDVAKLVIIHKKI